MPWDPRAPETGVGGALWFPRAFQGAGRHDNPERYGCLYTAESPVSALAEVLAAFRGAATLSDAMLVRFGRRLCLIELELASAALIDLDDPALLVAEGLRPSVVATRRRRATQALAADLFDAHPRAVGLRWWSTLESSWINVTLHERAAPRLTRTALRPLGVDDPAVREAATLLGLDPRPATA